PPPRAFASGRLNRVTVPHPRCQQFRKDKSAPGEISRSACCFPNRKLLLLGGRGALLAAGTGGGSGALAGPAFDIHRLHLERHHEGVLVERLGGAEEG